MPSRTNRKLQMQSLEQRQLMAGDIMFAEQLTTSVAPLPDFEAKLANVSQVDAASKLGVDVGRQAGENLSGDPDAGNPVVPNPARQRTVYRPGLRDQIGLFATPSGDGDASDPSAINPAKAIPGAEKSDVGSEAPTESAVEDLSTDLGARLGDRHSWAMDGEDNTDDQQCKTDQCHTADDDDDTSNSEERKRETVSPFGNPEDQQGHTPEEEKEDTSGVGDVEESPFFSKPAEAPDKGYEGQQVGGPLFASTPVPEGIAIEGGTVEDAEKDAEEKQSGFVDPGASMSEAERREALKWSRDADLFFESMDEHVDPLINPGGEGVDSSPITGVAPIPDNGLADPPKPSSGAGRVPSKRGR